MFIHVDLLICLSTHFASFGHYNHPHATNANRAYSFNRARAVPNLYCGYTDLTSMEDAALALAWCWRPRLCSFLCLLLKTQMYVTKATTLLSFSRKCSVRVRGNFLQIVLAYLSVLFTWYVLDDLTEVPQQLRVTKPYHFRHLAETYLLLIFVLSSLFGAGIDVCQVCGASTRVLILKEASKFTMHVHRVIL